MERGLNGDEQEKPKPVYASMTQVFQEAFPEYLAMGMSYAEFWEMESWLVRSYRKAKEIRINEINYSAWLHGLYTIKALQSGVPVLVNGFVKNHVELPQFPETPIDFSKEAKERQEKKQRDLAKARMRMIAEQFNATFKKRQEAKKAQAMKENK